MAQVVEHILGKDEVISSNLISSYEERILSDALFCYKRVIEEKGPFLGVLLF